jgi:hypothetical protein
LIFDNIKPFEDNLSEKSIMRSSNGPGREITVYWHRTAGDITREPIQCYRGSAPATMGFFG